MKDNEIIVSICCITYNHEKYIAQAIESFLKQKTNFKYEIVIQDDASTDNTVKIIENYKEKYNNTIRTIYHKKNIYSKVGASGVLLEALKYCRGKYIAICEGDDYWCDESKIQLQVEYMMENPNCTFCFHNAKKLDEATNKFSKFNYMNTKYKKKNHIYNAGELELYDCIPTASYMLKGDLIDNIPDWYSKCIVGDKPLQLIITSFGYAYEINKCMSVYRINTGNSAMDNIQKNNEDFEKADKYWKDIEWIIGKFNVFSDYKFDNYMLLSNLYIEKNILLYHKKYKEILKDKKYRKILNIKDVLKIEIKLYFPIIYNLLKKIKDGINGKR